MANVFEDEKLQLPEVIRVWQEMNREEKNLVIAFSVGVTAASHLSNANE